MVDIRDAVPEDLPKIVEIYNSTITSRMVTADTEPVSVQSKTAWFLEHCPDKYPIWVTEIDGEVAGWLSFQPFYKRPAYNGTAEISIYIAGKYRGHGLGKKLLGEALRRCLQLGITNVLGFVFAHNQPSLNLLKKFGFQQWGYLPKVALLDNSERDLKILGLRVTAEAGIR